MNNKAKQVLNGNDPSSIAVEFENLTDLWDEFCKELCHEVRQPVCVRQNSRKH